MSHHPGTMGECRPERLSMTQKNKKKSTRAPWGVSLVIIVDSAKHNGNHKRTFSELIK
jgi:hypothetical protein